MIPIKLSLQNFLSYRENNLLDLTGVQVACLCGANGHGKSALLDTMTWALWGWARGRRYGQGGSSADELIHQGQSEMEVSLEFYSNGTTYRVLRKFSRGSKTRGSATILDFQIAADGNFQSLTEGSITDTERRILNLLGMDYDTFINNSFLLQGQADRFTSSTPTKRKESLAEILRLSLFERLELRARKGLREHEKTLGTERATNKNLEESLSKEPEYLKALGMAHQTLQELEPNIRSVAQILEAHKTQLHSLDLRPHEADRLHHTANRAQEDEKELMKQIQGIKERTDHYSNLLDKENEITVGANNYYTRRDLLKTVDSDRVKHEELTFKERGIKN